MSDKPEQEPLFPTSNAERNAMQEEFLDLLNEIERESTQLALHVKTRKGAIAGLNKRAQRLEDLLRQSRPRK
jgi:predicted nuclease with TOPRIM domain